MQSLTKYEFSAHFKVIQNLKLIKETWEKYCKSILVALAPISYWRATSGLVEITIFGQLSYQRTSWPRFFMILFNLLYCGRKIVWLGHLWNPNLSGAPLPVWEKRGVFTKSLTSAQNDGAHFSSSTLAMVPFEISRIGVPDRVKLKMIFLLFYFQ